MSDLKPCPFCGDSVYINCYSVCCENIDCDAETQFSFGCAWPEMTERWNRRANEPKEETP